MAPGCQILSLYPSFANADACFYGIGMPGSLFSLANVAASFSTNKLLVVSIPSVPLLQMQQQAFGTGSLLSLTNSTASFSANKFPLSPWQNAVAWFWHRDKFSFSNPPLQIFLPLGWLFFHINSFSSPHSQNPATSFSACIIAKSSRESFFLQDVSYVPSIIFTKKIKNLIYYPSFAMCSSKIPDTGMTGSHLQNAEQVFQGRFNWSLLRLPCWLRLCRSLHPYQPLGRGRQLPSRCRCLFRPQE